MYKSAGEFVDDFHKAYNREAARAGDLNTEDHQRVEGILEEMKTESVYSNDRQFKGRLFNLFISWTEHPELFHYEGDTIFVLDELKETIEILIRNQYSKVV